MASLTLQDGTVFEGQSFGAEVDSDGPEAEQARFGTGEVVFNTGMAGYVESLTDPSYRGQILVFTYPLIGNYGVPSAGKNAWGFSENFESEAVHVRGVIVAQVSEDYSHQAAVSSLRNWLEHHRIPGITGVDTRALTKKLREHGVMLGRISQDAARDVMVSPSNHDIPDPNLSNLVAEVSCKEVITYEPVSAETSAGKPGAENGVPTVAVFDCGIKHNILRSLLKRGVRVHRVPWDFDLAGSDLQYDAVLVSNGPGDPKRCTATIAQMQKAMEKGIVTFGICLGNQLMALAVGGDTFKLKYGHRGVNQPCLEEGGPSGVEGRCIITSQNHGYAVSDDLPKGWKAWFRNANDGTIEGIRHESGKFFAVQFHPEAAPGPEDANYLFDEFVRSLRQ